MNQEEMNKIIDDASLSVDEFCEGDNRKTIQLVMYAIGLQYQMARTFVNRITGGDKVRSAELFYSYIEKSTKLIKENAKLCDDEIEASVVLMLVSISNLTHLLERKLKRDGTVSKP